MCKSTKGFDSLKLDVESISELDSGGTNTPMGLNGPHSSLYSMLTWFMRVGLARFTFMNKGVLVIM